MIDRVVESIIKSDEKRRSKPPTQEDIDETINLLDDFGIHTIVPKFDSLFQLYNWRRAAIKNRLS